MSEENSRESIIDTSRPNPGRIYDYWLGGHHNFEVDRQAAEQVMTLLPFVSKGVRMQRWCLQDIAQELTERRGFDTIIDFASGLPTNDHIHHIVPEGTTVVYSDFDPVVVEYAQEILGDTPNVHFFQADARRPEELLNRPELQEIIGNRRDVAIIFWGVTGFMDDEDISHAARFLYEWTSDKSCWVFLAQGAEMNLEDPSIQKIVNIYEQMGAPVKIRSLDKFKQLIQPWQPDDKGFKSILEWHGFDEETMSQEERNAHGPGGGGYGAYLVK